MGFWHFIVGKKTPEEKKSERIAMLKEILAMHKLIPSKEPNEHARNLATQFYLDDLVVSKKDGSIIASMDNNSFEKAVKGSSLYEFVSSEFPDAKMVLVKDRDNYNIIYPEGELLYLLKSSGEISTLETRKIAENFSKEIDVK